MNSTNGQAAASYPDPDSGTDGTGAVYGFHTNGVNNLMADGSVRFIGQSISIQTYAALVTRNGGEVIGDY